VCGSSRGQAVWVVGRGDSCCCERGEYLLVGVSGEQALSMMWSTGSMSSYLSWVFEREQQQKQQLPVQDGLQQMP